MFRTLEQDELSFIYQGSFIDGITGMVTKLIEKNIDAESAFSKLKNKVSFLMIESFQNIIRHGDKIDIENLNQRPGIFLTRCIGSIYYITSANLIENEKVETLKEKLVNVNTLDKEGLKKVYYEVLTNKELSSKGGAGLGLIQMARKSGEKLDFDFVKVNDEVSFFYLQMKLRGHGTEEEQKNPVPVESSKQFHNEASAQNIFIVHKGNYSQEAIRPVLKMVERNMAVEVEQNAQKMAFHLLVEILQNISKHAYKKSSVKEGIFIIAKEDERYAFCTGNYIDNTKIEKFKSQLEAINKLNKEELNELYRKTLIEGNITEGGGAGLGIIDIAREASQKLEFCFNKIDDKCSFYSLIVRL